MPNVYCKYCGRKASSVFSLTGSGCPKSPTKKHVPYEGSEKKEYVCKYCGRKASTIFILTGSACPKAPVPHGPHEPL